MTARRAAGPAIYPPSSLSAVPSSHLRYTCQASVRRAGCSGIGTLGLLDPLVRTSKYRSQHAAENEEGVSVSISQVSWNSSACGSLGSGNYFMGRCCHNSTPRRRVGCYNLFYMNSSAISAGNLLIAPFYRVFDVWKSLVAPHIFKDVTLIQQGGFPCPCSSFFPSSSSQN